MSCTMQRALVVRGQEDEVAEDLCFVRSHHVTAIFVVSRRRKAALEALLARGREDQVADSWTQIIELTGEHPARGAKRRWRRCWREDVVSVVCIHFAFTHSIH